MTKPALQTENTVQLSLGIIGLFFVLVMAGSVWWVKRGAILEVVHRMFARKLAGRGMSDKTFSYKSKDTFTKTVVQGFLGFVALFTVLLILMNFGVYFGHYKGYEDLDVADGWNNFYALMNILWTILLIWFFYYFHCRAVQKVLPISGTFIGLLTFAIFVSSVVYLNRAF
jgi:hypothetical protein